MKTLLPVALYCISLCLQLQALPVGDRLNFMTRLLQLKDGCPISPESDPGSVDRTTSPAVSLDRTSLWRALLHKSPPAPFEDSVKVFHVPHPARPEQGEEPNQKASRNRRHAFIRGHHHQHGQLMRVGCVLGTCQVQNLSHRLYQLMGQAGREDSSPINPRSPHSYG